MMFKYVIGGFALAAFVRTTVLAYNWWKSRKEDEEYRNCPELRYGVYKDPVPGPSWRLGPGEYYNPPDLDDVMWLYREDTDVDEDGYLPYRLEAIY